MDLRRHLCDCRADVARARSADRDPAAGARALGVPNHTVTLRGRSERQDLIRVPVSMLLKGMRSFRGSAPQDDSMVGTDDNLALVPGVYSNQGRPRLGFL